MTTKSQPQRVRLTPARKKVLVLLSENGPVETGRVHDLLYESDAAGRSSGFRVANTSRSIESMLDLGLIAWDDKPKTRLRVGERGEKLLGKPATVPAKKSPVVAKPAANRNRRGGRGMHTKNGTGLQSTGTNGNPIRKPKKLREYLEPPEVEALINAAPNPTAKLCMMIQWRSGLRISEAISLAPRDIHMNASPPELKVRQGKNSKDRIAPLHTELAAFLEAAVGMWKGKADEPLIGVTRQAAWRWYKAALNACYDAGTIPKGKPCGTHTLRHSAARYWLLNQVPISVVSKWLGHSNLGTTMVYAELISDPGGFMERVP